MSKQKILIVDDDNNIAELISHDNDLFKTSKDKIYALIGAGFALILFILSIIKI